MKVMRNPLIVVDLFIGIGIILPIEDAMERPQDFPLVLTFALSIVDIVSATIILHRSRLCILRWLRL